MNSQPDRPDLPHEGDIPATDAREPVTKILGEVFSRNYAPLQSYLRARGADPNDAPDIAVDAFIYTLQKFDTKSENFDRRSISAWMTYWRKTAKNFMINRGKHDRMRRKKLHVLEAETREVPSLQESLENEERMELWWRAVEQLEPYQKTLVYLRVWKGLEISEMVEWFRQRGIAHDARKMRRHIIEALTRCGLWLHATEEAHQ